MKPEITEEEIIFEDLENFNLSEVLHPYTRQGSYIEYGKAFVRFKKEGGKLYEIKVREIKERNKH